MTDTYFLIIACVVIGILLVGGSLCVVEFRRIKAELRAAESKLDALVGDSEVEPTDPTQLTDPSPLSANYEVRVYQLGDLLRATRLRADGFKEAGDRTLKSLYGDSTLPKNHFMKVTSLDTGNYTEQATL